MTGVPAPMTFPSQATATPGHPHHPSPLPPGTPMAARLRHHGQQPRRCRVATTRMVVRMEQQPRVQTDTTAMRPGLRPCVRPCPQHPAAGAVHTLSSQCRTVSAQAHQHLPLLRRATMVMSPVRTGRQRRRQQLKQAHVQREC